MKKITLIIKTLVSVLLLQFMFVGTCLAQEHRDEDNRREENGSQFTKEHVYKNVKNGVELLLQFDETTSSFVGTIENTSEKVVKRARVEVHLSNGIELGPTTPKDIKAGDKIEVKLSANGQVFDTWSTHAEIGSNEHGHDGGDEHSHER